MSMFWIFWHITLPLPSLLFTVDIEIRKYCVIRSKAGMERLKATFYTIRTTIVFPSQRNSPARVSEKIMQETSAFVKELSEIHFADLNKSTNAKSFFCISFPLFHLVDSYSPRDQRLRYRHAMKTCRPLLPLYTVNRGDRTLNHDRALGQAWN